MADIKDALLESENEKKELKAKLTLQAKLQFEMPYYWTIEEDGKKDGPFCQLCYDKEKKLIRLQYLKNGTWRCLSCTQTFRDKSYIHPQNSVFSNTNHSWN